jgi:hypothetical protein
MSTRIIQAVRALEQTIFEQMDPFEQLLELERRRTQGQQYHMTPAQFREIIRANTGEPDEHKKG